MSGDKGKRNSVSKPSGHKKQDSKSKPAKDVKKIPEKDADEEMTVVVPPVKPADAAKNEDVVMNGDEEEKKEKLEEETVVDPKEKAIAGMLSHNMFDRK